MSDASVVVEFTSRTQMLLPFYLPGYLQNSVRGLVITVTPLFLISMENNYDDVGFVTSFIAVGGVVASLTMGNFIMAQGPRFTLLVANAIFAVSGFIGATAGGAAQLCAACFFLGFAEATGMLCRQTLIGACVAPSSRGRVSSTMGGMVRLSFTTGPIVGGAVAHRWGSRSVYAMQIVLAAFASLVILMQMPFVRGDQVLGSGGSGGGKDGGEGGKHGSSPADGGGEGGAPGTGNSTALTTCGAAVRHWRALLLIGGFITLFNVVKCGRELFISLVGHERGLSQQQIGVAAFVSFVLDFFLFPVAGWLLDHLGRAFTGALSVGIASAGVLVLRGRADWYYMAFAVIAGVGNGLSSGIQIVLGADIAPPDCRGQFLAAYRLQDRFANVLGPVIVGLVAERLSLRAAELVVVCFGVGAVAWALGLLRGMGAPAPESVVSSVGPFAGAPAGKASSPTKGSKGCYIGVAPNELGRRDDDNLGLFALGAEEEEEEADSDEMEAFAIAAERASQADLVGNGVREDFGGLPPPLAIDALRGSTGDASDRLHMIAPTLV